VPAHDVDRTRFVFESARPHVADWPPSLWHSEVHQPHSSQALCVSVWGTIAMHPDRADILQRVLSTAGLTLGAPAGANVRCEAGAEHELAALLNETGGNATPTCVDALVEWRDGTVAIESKFTESSFGSCGQLRERVDVPPGAPDNRQKLGPACTGRYGRGSDLKTRTNAPCRLATWDGDRAPRLYWDIAWELFKPEVLVPDGRACPFAGPSFQLMRNLALARARSAPRSFRRDRSSPVETSHPYWGMVIVNVASHRNSVRHRAELDEFRQLLRDDVQQRVGLISYEQIDPILCEHGLSALAADIQTRIASATQ
jgi:hypothetical protein